MICKFQETKYICSNKRHFIASVDKIKINLTYHLSHDNNLKHTAPQSPEYLNFHKNTVHFHSNVVPITEIIYNENNYCNSKTVKMYFPYNRSH